MSAIATFERLSNRYVLTCGLAAEEGLHVGTGVAGQRTDAPFILRDGKAFLPGSSLRGPMRAAVERIMRTLYPGTSCVLADDDEMNAGVPCACAAKKTREKLEADTREMEKALDNGQLRLCPVCALFGSTLMAAKLKISDGVQTGTPRKPERRDGVGIDRDTETAREKIKYDFEVLNPEARFEFRMQLENAGDSDFGLLYILLKELEHGLDVGGKKSRGLGRVKLDGYRVEYFDESGDRGLVGFLEKGYSEMTAAEFEAKLKTAFGKLGQKNQP